MQWLRKQSPALMLCVGLSAGLLIGVGMLVGAVVSFQVRPTPAVLPPQALQATATQGNDSFVVATGPIAENVEGFFALDCLTGNVSCRVLNSRTGGLGGLYATNVIAALGVNRERKPKYLMVTGRAPLRYLGGQGVTRPAQSILYVLDANTGNFAAYVLPWNPQIAVSGLAQQYPMVLMGAGKLRALDVRE